MDGDGYTNGVEFVTGTNPLNGNSRPLQTLQHTGTEFRFTFTLSPLAEGLGEVTSSTDFVTWTPVALDAYTVVGFSNEGDLVRVTLSVTGVPRLFLRIEYVP